MKDSTLQRIWDARKAISKKFDFDPRKLVAYYQSREQAYEASKNKENPSR